MNERAIIINKIWNEIHVNKLPVFQLDNNYNIAYYYDEYSDVLRSEDGFCVLIELFNNELNKEYILDLIEKLKVKSLQNYNDILNNKKEIIISLWNEIFKNKLPIFYWSDNTKTSYYYDEKTDTIRSDNGFCVLIDKHTEDINKEYIIELIDKLKAIVDLYKKYMCKHNI